MPLPGKTKGFLPQALSLVFITVQRGSRTGETAIQGGSRSTDAQTIV